MDLVATAQLSFPVLCSDAILLSNCSAHVTEMLLCCSAFASLDQKSPVVSSHFHCSDTQAHYLEETPNGAIAEYRFDKTKQHTLTGREAQPIAFRVASKLNHQSQGDVTVGWRG